MSSRTKFLVMLCLFLLGSRAFAQETAKDDGPQTDFKAFSAARGQDLIG